MVTGIPNTSAAPSIQSFDATGISVKVVAQSPDAVRNGKITVRFEATDFDGARPEALKLDGKVYAIQPMMLPFSPIGGQLYYDVDVPAFSRDGDHKAQVLVKNAWQPLVLKVLIPLHKE